MTGLDLAINNGTVVNADGTARVHVGVRGGRIAVLSDRPLEANRQLDASGLLVLPGAIDCHVHFLLKQGQGETAVVTEDDYVSGPVSAARGGVTTFIDFALHPRDTPPSEFMAQRIDLASQGSCIDFAFHAGILDPRGAVLEELPKIVDMGIPSFKFFVTYRKWGFAVDLGFLNAAMTRIHELGGIACLHAEQDEILEWRRTEHAGQQDLIYHSLTRPDFTEEIAVYEAVVLARETGCALYIVHLSTAKALAVIRRARAEGIPVTTETCPHYLAFDHDVYRRPDGVLFTMTPPLRPPGNCAPLWEGLADGSISVLSSDHNAVGRRVKESKPHFLDVAPGLSGSGTLLPFAYSEGVSRGRLTLPRMVEVTSTAPARIYRLAHKGAVRVGYDADFAILDPEADYIVRVADLDCPAGYTVFEGQRFRGRISHTIVRGKFVVENGMFVGRSGYGRFIARPARALAAAEPERETGH
ncbi:MAG: amidohydrolase family protein [Acidobacteria bacterium]|nr:amidohydrolase family protein [Acidobacteriota bacterium]